jgi:hypothetical protein
MNELPEFPDSIFLYDFILEWTRVQPNIKRDHTQIENAHIFPCFLDGSAPILL